MLRPALEAAVAVARRGAGGHPGESPLGLRPFLNFSHLPPAALPPVRKAVEEDEAFRARVRDAVTHDDVGRASWLWLDRPEGWEDELADVAADVRQAEREAAEAHDDRTARRRLAAAEGAARRAAEDAATARTEADAAKAALNEARRARRAAETEAGRARRARVADQDRAEAAERRAQVAEAARDELQARVAAAAEEVAALRRQVAELVIERDRLAVAPPPPPTTDTTAPAHRGPSTGAARGGGPASGRSMVDLPAVGAALVDAADALRALATSVGAAAAALSAPPRPDADRPPEPDAESATSPSPRDAAAAAAPAAAPARRRPLALPPAVFEDSPEAARHLVRVPGVALVVDGYNVSLEAWPDQPLAEQRRRLVDALAELAARCGPDVHVVFDGAEGEASSSPFSLPRRSRLRVTFSPPGVEADEVVLDLARVLVTSGPVVVATSDRRVQDGARRLGANVIASPQLLAVLRR